MSVVCLLLEPQEKASMEAEQGDVQQLAALQADASNKASGYEARKRAKLTSDDSKAGDAGRQAVNEH